VVDCAPVGEDGLEGGFDFPVLDEVLDELGEGARYMVHLLRWFESVKITNCQRQCSSLSANTFLVLE
jgi:hypothetical protein